MKNVVARALILGLPLIVGLPLANTTPCFAAPYRKSHTPEGTPKKGEKKAEATSQELIIDAIVAAVDDKPITLSDLNARLAPRRVTLSEAKKTPEASLILDQIILEKLLEEEAKVKRVTIGESEVDEYMREVMQRNGLSQDDFQAALAKEGRSVATYKQQIKIDILKAKLGSSLARGGTSVSDSELNEYIANHPELKNGGRDIKLHHLVISKEGRSIEDVKARLMQVSTALEGGESFPEVAKKLSDTASSGEGSLIGVIPLKDLSPAIAEAVAPLHAGQHTPPLETPADIQLFFVEERLGSEDESPSEVDEEKLHNEVRQILQKQKTKERLDAFFKNDLYKKHAVDKRL
jgi:peptidyl-prolyl cis-trans isomerase SurA